MDQASFLRELMNKNQGAKKSPVAIVSLSSFSAPEQVTKELTTQFSNLTQRNVVLLGLSQGEQKNLQRCMVEKGSVLHLATPISLKASVIPGTLDFVSSLSNQPAYAMSFIEQVKEIERSADTLFYYAGQGLQTTAINLAMMARKVILLVKPTKESLAELMNYIQIFIKTKSNSELGILLEVSTKEQYEEEVKKIQELYWSQYKYYIEPVGYVKRSGLKYGEEVYLEQLNTEYLLKKSETNLFSESLATAFL